MKAPLRLLAIALILLSVGHAHPKDIRDHLRETQAETLVVAHRADWRGFPENSVPAIESAIAMGLEMVEIDLRRTKDGHFVLMHDETVDRTTTGAGKVANLTLVEIRQLYLRDGLGSPTGFVVPTLREVLLVTRGRIWLNLDKSYDHIREILPILEETETLGQVLFKGVATVEVVQDRYGDLLARVAYMPVIRFREANAPELVRAWLDHGRPMAMELVFAEWTPTVAQAFALCRERGVRIWVNTLWPQLAAGLSDDRALDDPDAVYGLLLERGVSIFQTDRPRELQAYLSKRAVKTP